MQTVNIKAKKKTPRPAPHDRLVSVSGRVDSKQVALIAVSFR